MVVKQVKAGLRYKQKYPVHLPARFASVILLRLAEAAIFLRKCSNLSKHA